MRNDGPAFLITPGRLLEALSGHRQLPEGAKVDCDEIAALLSAGIFALGASFELVTVSTNPTKPWEFDHVYPLLKMEGLRVPLDVSFEIGMEQVWRRKVWSYSGSGSSPNPSEQKLSDDLEAIADAAIVDSQHPLLDNLIRDVVLVCLELFLTVVGKVAIGEGNGGLSPEPRTIPVLDVSWMIPLYCALHHSVQELKGGVEIVKALEAVHSFSRSASQRDVRFFGWFLIRLPFFAKEVFGDDSKAPGWDDLRDYLSVRWPNLGKI